MKKCLGWFVCSMQRIAFLKFWEQTSALLSAICLSVCYPTYSWLNKNSGFLVSVISKHSDFPLYASHSFCCRLWFCLLWFYQHPWHHCGPPFWFVCVCVFVCSWQWQLEWYGLYTVLTCIIGHIERSAQCQCQCCHSDKAVVSCWRLTDLALHQQAWTYSPWKLFWGLQMPAYIHRHAPPNTRVQPMFNTSYVSQCNNIFWSVVFLLTPSTHPPTQISFLTFLTSPPYFSFSHLPLCYL